MSTEEQPKSRKYPIEIHFVPEEDGDGHYVAFLPDFGLAACSGTGTTIGEALRKMTQVKEFVLERWRILGKELPKPSVLCPECSAGRQPKCFCSSVPTCFCSGSKPCSYSDPEVPDGIAKYAEFSDTEGGDDLDALCVGMHIGVEGVRMSRRARKPSGKEALREATLSPKEAETLRQADEAWSRRAASINKGDALGNGPTFRECAQLLVKDLVVRHEQLRAHVLLRVSERLGVSPAEITEALFDAVIPWVVSLVEQAKRGPDESN